jgi:hypothetical protein
MGRFANAVHLILITLFGHSLRPHPPQLYLPIDLHSAAESSNRSPRNTMRTLRISEKLIIVSQSMRIRSEILAAAMRHIGQIMLGYPHR